MRTLLTTILLSLMLPLLAATPARAAGYRVEEIPNVQLTDRNRYVSNPDRILSEAAVARIDSLCGSLRRQGIAQVAVVAVDEIAGDDLFTFAIDLFRRWGVGRAGDDNGVGILLVRDRREIRFVTGYGVEGVLTDALCKRIQTQLMLPRFRTGDYSGGMVAGVEAVAGALTGSGIAFGEEEPDDGPLPVLYIFSAVILFFLATSLLALHRRRQEKRCPRCHKHTLVREERRVLGLTPQHRIVEYTFVCTHCGHVVRRQEREWRDNGFGGRGGGPIIGGFGGFGGLGGFGGGGGSMGGGFGGGSFGGGGAGSRW